MNRLEAKALIEADGYYEEEDEEYILETYDELIKNIGFEDNRRDKRYVVKFHDIGYYMPYEDENEVDFWNLFDLFCQDQIEWMDEENEMKDIDEEIMLTSWNTGHYPAFRVDIEEITDENAVELAMKIYDEVGYSGKEYVKNYIFMVNNLQAMEDNYMYLWFDFLRCGEYMPEKDIKEMEEKYKLDQERRKNVTTHE